MVCIGIFGFMGLHVKKQTVQRRWSVEKRLEFIDFRLYWEGQINRSDIRDRFGVALLQASKDIAQYQEAAPKNLDYDLREKRYFSARTFKPAFLDPDSEAYLWQMRDDVSAMSGIDGAWLPDLPPHDIVRMPRRNVAAETLREIVSAIRRKKAVEILYQSMSSEEPAWRAISPHAFVFDGLRWHVRAFCHQRQKHKDFLLSRVQDMRESGESPVSGVQDAVWNEIFTVTLKPHPKLSIKSSPDRGMGLQYAGHAPWRTGSAGAAVLFSAAHGAGRLRRRRKRFKRTACGDRQQGGNTQGEGQSTIRGRQQK